ncbi:MAG: UDP-2,3-diacylglucosamine diphosphatase LpxI [Alphaproteobacteria bacterium]|nr:UDP-2,3-diacylglucosamine diphosphatase LpxI [Alphaproteobacteria bacterium]
MMRPRLGLLAGGGELPRLILDACRRSGREVFVVAFKDQCDPETVQGVDHAWMRLGAAGSTIRALKDHGVGELVMAGRIRRPSLAGLMPDAKAMKILAGGVFNRGDDGLLRAIMNHLERTEGFRMVGVHEVMPELLTPEGVLGRAAPDARARADMDVACRAALDLGAEDRGQAAVALEGRVVATEGPDGTDAMLKRLAASGAAHGGVLAKMCKPGQDRRADLPTIGRVTVENAHAAGLKGIVVEAGASLTVGRDEIVRAADGLGLFVAGVKI